MAVGLNLPVVNCFSWLLLVCVPIGVHSRTCYSTNLFRVSTECDYNQHCCGDYNDQCCDKIQVFTHTGLENLSIISVIITVAIITCCCICCYRCCCKRTTSRGYVYTTPGATTAVTVAMPPQQQPLPYPTVVPYPQQTPYPPQYNPPINPYYGMQQPPAYGVSGESHQQASAPPFV